MFLSRAASTEYQQASKKPRDEWDEIREKNLMSYIFFAFKSTRSENPFKEGEVLIFSKGRSVSVLSLLFKNCHLNDI